VSTSTGGTPSKRQRTAKLISRERDTTAHDHDDADAASDSSITKQQASSVRAAVSLGEAVATLHSKSASLSSKLDMIEQLSSGFSSVGASGESLIELRNNHAFKVLLSFVISTWSVTSKLVLRPVSVPLSWMIRRMHGRGRCSSACWSWLLPRYDSTLT